MRLKLILTVFVTVLTAFTSFAASDLTCAGATSTGVQPQTLEWNEFEQRALENQSYGKWGLYLQTLPQKTKDLLLQKAGEVYAKEKNREIVQPIHVLLNPKAMYEKYKKEGRSDRQFYNDYLALIKKKVFSQKEVGGYTGDMIIEIAEVMRSYLQTKPELQAFNFFGSVPNGFAKKTSDYDLFNHPVQTMYPDRLQEQIELGHDKFVDLRYQIHDPILQSQLDQIVGDTEWSTWHLEQLWEKAHEHFGAVSHVFSFHITKERVILRFYPNYIRVDAQGKEQEAFEFIELDI